MISPNWRTKIRELQLRDKIDLFLTCGIFAATAIYAAVAIYQCGANETELQAYVSFDSMNSPKRIVEVSKLPESYRLLNGYSIKPGAHLFILEAGGNLHNFGKTPAQQVRFGLKYVTRKYADPIGAVRCPLSKEVGLSAPLFISPDIGFPSGPVPLVIDKPTTDRSLQNRSRFIFMAASVIRTFFPTCAVRKCAVFTIPIRDIFPSAHPIISWMAVIPTTKQIDTNPISRNLFNLVDVGGARRANLDAHWWDRWWKRWRSARDSKLTTRAPSAGTSAVAVARPSVQTAPKARGFFSERFGERSESNLENPYLC